VTLLNRLMPAVLAVLLAMPAVAEVPTPVAAARDADVIALCSPHEDKLLLRVRFDRSTGKVSFAPFGPPGVEIFAVAPRGAFTVYAGIQDPGGNASPALFMLDEAGQALGKPLASPIGAIATLAVSPKGDWVAASGQSGWIAMFAVERTGPARRLVARAKFAISPDRGFSYAFRPEGGIAILTEDWVLTFRANDGSVQRTLDLKPLNRDLPVVGRGGNVAFKLTWSPRGDRFAVNWGGGPIATTIFDRTGRALQPRGGEVAYLAGSNVEFVSGGDALIVHGMEPPALISMATLTKTPFSDENLSAAAFVSQPGGRTVAVLSTDHEASLWSMDGKPLVAPAGLENYTFGAAAAGADGELIVAAGRGGWIDIFTRQGAFLRRVQAGTRGSGSGGNIALSADGAVAGAFDWGTLGVFSPTGARLWGAAHSYYGTQDFFIAVAADGSRIAAAGPDRQLRSWARDGSAATSFELRAGDEVPSRLMGLAVSSGGDAIAVADEKPAVWIAYPADKRVQRVPLRGGASSVAALPDGTGFVVGLVDGSVVRIERDGAIVGTLVKGTDQGSAGRIVVAPDGKSLVVIGGDEISARHLAWNGEVLTGPIRMSRYEHIKGAFFENGAPLLIVAWRSSDSTIPDTFQVVDFGTTGKRQARSLDRPRP